ncbi:MAG: hypothetical protein ABEJ72_06750, partial [Candidatus Aenigmatarchaeota archaeon]
MSKKKYKKVSTDDSYLYSETQESQKPDKGLFVEKLERIPAIKPRTRDVRYAVSALLVVVFLAGFLFVYGGQITGFFAKEPLGNITASYTPTSDIPERIQSGESYSLSFDIQKKKDYVTSSGEISLEITGAGGKTEVEVVETDTNSVLCEIVPGKEEGEYTCDLNKNEIRKIMKGEYDLE